MKILYLLLTMLSINFLYAKDFKRATETNELNELITYCYILCICKILKQI